ncbi:MAG: Phosphate transport regulator (distant homolog of PhoU), partial [uncultured Nocardioides sp.]
AFEVPSSRCVVLRPVQRAGRPPRRRSAAAEPDAVRRQLEGRDRAAHARGRARRRRDDPRDHPAGQQHLRHAVRPGGHLRPGLGARRRDGHDGRGGRPRPPLRGDVAPAGDDRAGRGAPALRRADRCGDAHPGVDEVARRVLDRDQPSRERGRQVLPPHPGQPLQRRARGPRGAEAQGRRRIPRGGDRRVREGRQHRGADRGQGVL